MKKNKFIWLGLSAVVLGTAAFFVYDALSKSKKTATNSNEDQNSTSTDLSSNVNNASIGNSSFPLKVGSKGVEVAALQKFLNATSSSGLVVDGIFGPLTLKAWLNEQLCDTVINTSTECWKQFLIMYPNSEPGKVTQQYYEVNVKSKYE